MYGKPLNIGFLLRHPMMLLLCLILFLAGCSSLVDRPNDTTATTTGKYISRGLLALPTFGASERRIKRERNSIPITDGFHTRLSPAGSTIVVMGSNIDANNAAITWLQKRGVSIVERTHLDQILAEQRRQLTYSSDEEGMLLQAGRILGASEIVFVETSPTSVSVRSVELANGKIGWTGRAHYKDMKIAELGNPNMNLTCQALATAWGFRQPGDIYIPSQIMCELASTRPPTNQ
jgi:hypothetical protein